MKILILGSGGREHALGWAVQRESGADLVFAPGNLGTALLGRNVALPISDHEALLELARREAPDFTVVGPEQPLADGLADRFRAAGLPVFGPSRRAAQIEASKVLAKRLMREAGIPTAAFEVYEGPEEALASLRRSMFPQVIKADGLAQGKGVYIARNQDEGEAALREIFQARRFGAAGDQVVVESFLHGEEVSAFALCRDEEFQILALARDYKRLRDGDEGPNTGGMGAIAPHPLDSPALRHTLEETVFGPTLRTLARAGRPFQGLLYAGLMMVDDRPYVLEFNCRFGDPETQAVLPLVERGLVAALRAVATGAGPLPAMTLWREGDGLPTAAPAHAATVVLAAAGYPTDPRVGDPISGLEAAAELPETFVFHAGTRREGTRVLTAGGRVLAVTGRGATPRIALSRAYDAASLIQFEGKQLRGDIGRSPGR